MRVRASLTVGLVLVTLAACSADRAGLGGLDASSSDMGADAPPADHSMGDAIVDGAPDARDLGVLDAGDTGVLDMDVDLGPDAMPIDLGPDTGPPDLGTDLGPPDLGVDGGPCGPTCLAPMLCCGSSCVDPRVDPGHCGGCTACPGAAHATPTCAASTCGTTCDSGFGDCTAAPGCESDLTTLATCGSCGNTCTAAAHQTAVCGAGGVCSAPCDSGFGDCTAAPGCESDLTTLATCGSCTNTCTAAANQTAMCGAGGVCSASCNAGFGDCTAAPGCESDLTTLATCGSCTNACTAAANQTAACGAGGVCSASCNAGFGDCTAAPGCESSLSTVATCGSCTNTCTAAANQTAVCGAGGVCSAPCNAGFADCTAAPGCESDLTTLATCGSCTNTCTAAANQTATCGAGGVCSATCNPGFADCTAAPGCETDTTSSAAHCGSCAMVCSVGRTCASSVCSTGWILTSAVGAPSGRTDHTAVWTGTRMIIWGGDGPGGSLNTGASYDPATDTWSAVTLTGAPPARRGHAAVWTGTEMLVWGGYSTIAGNFLQDGGAYNPATNTWRTINTGGRPSTRSRFPSVWSGTEMMVWGGWQAGGGGTRNDGGLYDSAGDSWSAITNTARPLGRRWDVGVWTGLRMVVWGGEDGAGNPLADGAFYDPVTDAWTVATNTTGAPSARARAAYVFAGTIPTPAMLVWGGDDGDGGGIFGNGVRNTGARLDTIANTWSAMSASPLVGRSRATAVWTGSKMMIWGGRGADTGFGMPVYLGDGASYDPVTNTWSMLSAIAAPTARSDHTAVWTGTEMIVWGGFAGVTPLGTGGRYAP